MEIKSAEFITSFADSNKYLEVSEGYTCDELCVVGRSNVGKSAFINMVSGKNKLARTSSTPGRTRLINLFNFNEGKFTLVDLPGYGYAAAAKNEKNKWGELIEGYLKNSQKLKHVFCLVDIRHEPSALDKRMLMYLYHYSIGFTIIATKSDKLSRVQLDKNIQIVATALAVGRDNIIVCSSVTNYGRNKILKKLSEVFDEEKK